MKNILQKFTSRKFVVSLGGVLTGIGVIASGNITEGIVTVVTSVLAYLITEGIIDARAIDTTNNTVDKVIEQTKKKLEGDNDDKLL